MRSGGLQKDLLLEIRFFLPLEPFSINAAFSRDRRYKTKAYKDWEILAFTTLTSEKVQAELQKIREAFIEHKHVFHVEFLFEYANLFTKQGKINSKVEDLSNVEKILLDLLFLPKYHIQSYPYGCPNINTDDKYVLKLISEKRWAKSSGTHVVIKLIDAPTKPTAHP